MEINYARWVGNGIRKVLDVRGPLELMGYFGLALGAGFLTGEGLSNLFPNWHLDTSAARLEEILGFGMFAVARIASGAGQRTTRYDG